MAHTANFTAKSTIGLKKLAICPLTADNEEGHTYGAVQVLEAPINITATPQNTDPDDQYAGDVLWDRIYGDPEYTVSVELADLPLDLRAMILGHTIDGAGNMVVADTDKPGDFAIGFQSAKSNGKNRFVWFYKCTASPVTDTYHTKEGQTITRQTGTVEFKSVKRTHDGMAYIMADDDTAGSTVSADTWFTAVVEKAAS